MASETTANKVEAEAVKEVETKVEDTSKESSTSKQFDDGKDLLATTGAPATQGLDAFAKELGELPGLGDRKIEEKTNDKDKKDLKGDKESTNSKDDKKGKISDDEKNIESLKVIEAGKSQTSHDDNKSPKEETIDDKEVSTRDFNGLEENEIPLLKRMSNPAFNYVKPALLELKNKRESVKKLEAENASLKAGKVTLPDNYYEHPQAFVLTPEFGEISNNIRTLDSFQSHWERQLLNIKEGKDWNPIVDDGKGNYTLGAAQPATPASEIAVMRDYQHVTRQLGEQQGMIRSLEQNHTNKYKEGVTMLKGKEKELFGYMDDDKRPENKTYKEIKSMFHSSFQNNPVVDIAAKALTAVLQYKAAYELLAGKQGKEAKIAETIKEDAKKAGPTNKTIDSAGGKQTDKKVTIDMFKEAME